MREFLSLPKKYPGLEAIPSEIVYFMGCGKFPQFCSTVRAICNPDKYCPFCIQNSQGREVLAQCEGWRLLKNDFPKPELEIMLLVVPDRHITDIQTLTERDWVALGTLTQIGTEAGYGGGGVFRFGDSRRHMGTIPHFHLNLYGPTGKMEFRSPLAKTEKKLRQDYARMLRFRQELLAEGGQEFLFGD